MKKRSDVKKSLTAEHTVHAIYDKKDLCKIDEAAAEKTNGIYTDPDAEQELKTLRIRDLIEYCNSGSKDISKVSREEILQFCKKDNI